MLRRRCRWFINRMTDRRGQPTLGFVDTDRFIRDGYLAIPGAVDAETVAACQELIWESMAKRGVRRDDPATWPRHLRIDDLDTVPFTAAGTAPKLTAAYDELIGAGRWSPPVHVGKRDSGAFPSEDRANAGHHIEGSYRSPTAKRAGSTSVPVHAGCSRCSCSLM